MYEYHLVVRAIMEDRIREAEHERLTHVKRRRERSSTPRRAVGDPKLHSRLWYLAHFRRAYS